MHGLYECLLSEVAFKDGLEVVGDVPLLLAPLPFKGATVTKLQTKVRGCWRRDQPAGGCSFSNAWQYFHML